MIFTYILYQLFISVQQCKRTLWRWSFPAKTFKSAGSNFGAFFVARHWLAGWLAREERTPSENIGARKHSVKRYTYIKKDMYSVSILYIYPLLSIKKLRQLKFNFF